MQPLGCFLTALLLWSPLFPVVVTAGDAFLPTFPRAAFAPRGSSSVVKSLSHPHQHHASILDIRGGATIVDEEEEEDFSEDEREDESEDEMEDDVAEEDDELDASLAAAAVKSTQKAKFKAQSAKTSLVKETMSTKLASKSHNKSKKMTGSLLKFLRVPYILRACLNPVTVLSMTKHFWLSLVNLEYPPKDQSQDLRSALDQKARKGGGTPSPARGKRKMKRGQAKTLSDLPKLNT